MRPVAGHTGTFQWTDRPLLLSLLVLGLMCLLTGLMVPPIYSTNDDLVFNLLAAGVGVTDVPDGHLLFTSVMIGNLLARLYTLLPTVPWYPLYLSIAMWLACSSLLYVLLLRLPAAKALIFFSLYVGLFGVMLFSRMQFTITAMQCGLAGFALLHHAWEQKTSYGRQEILIFSSGVGMLILAAAIRIHVILWLVILALPLLALSYWTSDKRGRIGLSVLGAICIALWAGIYLIDIKAYHDDPQWTQFQEINSLRSSFNDYHQVQYSDKFKSIFESEGWDRLDFEMINEWFYADEKKYGIETLRRIVAQFPARKQDFEWSDINRALRLSAGDPLALAAVTFIAWLLVFGGVQGQGKVVVLGMLSTLIFAIPLMHIMAKAPPAYLLWPTLAFMAYWPMHWATARQDHEKEADAGARTGLAVGIILLALGGIVTYTVAIRDARDQKVGKEYLSRILQPSSDKSRMIYVVWGNSLPPGLVSAYRWGEVLRGIDVIWIGASLHSPITKRQLRRLHISNLYRALYERPDVLLLNSKPSRERLLAEYELKRYGVSVEFTQESNQYGLRLLKVSGPSEKSASEILK